MKSMNKTAISVPVGQCYRLLFLTSTLEPLSFMTHEQYNKPSQTRWSLKPLFNKDF